MAETKEVVVAILRFLERQQNASAMDEETRESLEVATQCLETAYGVHRDDALPTDATLQDIYAAGVEKIKSSGDAAKKHEASPEQKEAADKLKAEGNNLMKDEKFNEALDCYSKAIDKDGQNAVYFCNRAAAYSKLNDHQKALEDCMKALEIDPKYSKAYGRKGLAHTALNQHYAARDCYKRALELDPANDSYKNNLQLAETKIMEEQGMPGMPGMGGMPGMPGMGPGGLNMGGMDFSQLLNNPALMNMAQSMLSNPQMQNMMANMMSGQMGAGAGPGAGGQVPPDFERMANMMSGQAGQESEGPAGIEGLLQAGQALAQQMQESNPELVEQLRQRYRPDGDEGGQDPPPSGGSS